MNHSTFAKFAGGPKTLHGTMKATTSRLQRLHSRKWAVAWDKKNCTPLCRPIPTSNL